MKNLAVFFSVFISVCVCACVCVCLSLSLSLSLIGLITVRTHTYSRVVNQLSRFHTSAGIQPRNSLSTVPHKSTSPVTVMPLQQIKQPHSSGKVV